MQEHWAANRGSAHLARGGRVQGKEELLGLRCTCASTNPGRTVAGRRSTIWGPEKSTLASSAAEYGCTSRIRPDSRETVMILFGSSVSVYGSNSFPAKILVVIGPVARVCGGSCMSKIKLLIMREGSQGALGQVHPVAQRGSVS